MTNPAETFSGGIDTTQDPALLEPGVHQAIRNMIYTQDSDTLMRMPGRALWKDVGGGDPIVGLLACSFDNGLNYVVAADGTTRKIYNASSGATVATDTVTTTTLGGVQYDNRYFMYDGTNVPTMLLQDGTTRQVGLTPITEQIAGLATASGSWLGIATGYFDYWITEVWQATSAAETADPDAPYELESAYLADPQTIKVENMNTRVAVRLPATLTNAHATHFRVYRAGPKATEDAKEFPIGEQVIVDTKTANAGQVVYDGSSTSTTVPIISNTSDGVIAQWVNPENVYGTGYAVQATASTGGTRALARCSNIYSVTGTISDDIKDPIVGLQLDVAWQLQVNVATATGSQRETPGYITMSVSFDGGTTWNSVASQGESNRTNVNATGVYSFGGPEALWGMANLERADFDSANFKVKLKVSEVSGNTSSWAPKVAVDSVSVIVHYNGAGLETYRQYNAIVLEALGQQTAFSAAGAPPPSTTATIFEGAIVSNNTDKPSWIQYSQAGAIEYWPELYFLNFETDDRDEVTYVGTINNKLVVGLRGALYRVNYLPTEEDADGRRGLAYERISRTHGIVNAKSACQFQGPDGRELLAFVSHNGIFATDGYTITKLSSRLNWRTLMGLNSAFTYSLGLTNDPDLGLIWFHTQGAGSYALHYQGKLRWTGPHTTSNTNQPLSCAICVRQANGSFRSFLGYDDGEVWRTDQLYNLNGTWVPANDYAVQECSVLTRRFAPAGVSGEGTLDTLFIYGGFIPSRVDFLTHHPYWGVSGQPTTLEQQGPVVAWSTMAPVRVDCLKTSGGNVSIELIEDAGADFLPLQELHLRWSEVKEANLA